MEDLPLRVAFAGLHVGRGDFPAHYHEVWELVYVRDGAVVTHQAGEPLHLASGMVLVNPAFVPHRDVYLRPYHLIYLFVEGASVEACERIVYDDPERTLGRVFEAILAEWNAQAPDGAAMLDLLAAQLEILLRRRSRACPASPREAPLIEAERLLRGSVGAPQTLERIARQVGVSRSWLCREFKRAHGKAPYEHVAQLRLEKALALLRLSSHKAAFIAEECGYASASHLASYVKKATGLTPSQIRNASRELPSP